AARAGIEYAEIACTPLEETRPSWCTSAATNIAAINTAATSATGLTVTATSSSFFGCPSATSVTPQANGSQCSSGGIGGIYVTITATTSYTPLFHSCGELLPATICPLSNSASSMSSTAISRIN